VATETTTANFPDTGVDTGYGQLQMEKSVGTTTRFAYIDYILLDYLVSR